MGWRRGIALGAMTLLAARVCSLDASRRSAGASVPAFSPRADAAACALPPPSGARTYALRFDQLGYSTKGERWAVVLGAGAQAPAYRVFDARTGCVVGEGRAGPRVLDTTSLAKGPLIGDRVDLSMIERPGRYLVVLEDGSQFGPLMVDDAAYAEVAPKVAQFLAVQRCGSTSHALSQHGPCHLFASTSGAFPAFSGDGVAVADGYRGRVAKGTSVNAEGGWHDAGDYVKFVGTTAFVLAVDLMAMRDHPRAFAGKAREQLRVEMRWGLDWLARMLAGPELFYQVSGENDHDAPWRAPEADTWRPVAGYDQRPVFRFGKGKGKNLLGRAAAAFALGAQVFSEDAEYAARLLESARRAYDAAAARNDPQSTTPPNFYPEDSTEDDAALGAAALARATGDASFATKALAHARRLGEATSEAEPLYWGDVSALALLEAARALPAASADRAELARALTLRAAPFLAASRDPAAPGAPFRYAMPTFGNGSVAQSLGAACVCLAARALGGSAECVELARAQLHWLFGQNPFGVSFMVGAGTRFPENVHHSLAQAAGFTLTGAIVGGPTSLATLEADRALPHLRRDGPFSAWSTPALAYDDVRDNYVVNEPAIDFTAPLLFVLAALEAGDEPAR